MEIILAKQSFGELLRELRESFGISMRGLATSADMDPAYLSRMETGKSGDPKAETVERLAEALSDSQQLASSDGERLKRRLLVASGHLQNREALIDDLAERFAARLRDEGFPEEKIDEALARVPLATMRAVLLGEEKLEIGYAADYSSDELWARKDAGEDIFDFNLGSQQARTREMRRQTVEPVKQPRAKTADSATSYLDRHAEDFATYRRQRRAQSSRPRGRVIRAGREAEIRVHRSLTKEQEHQLRLMAKLIDTILEEK